MRSQWAEHGAQLNRPTYDKEKIMPSNRRTRGSQEQTSSAAHGSATGEYTVGYGRPPKEFQFKPGQSGNPAGSKGRARLVGKQLKALIERALREKAGRV
jgi:hypothetical protein